MTTKTIKNVDATNVNNDDTNASNDDATTTNARATTRAIRDYNDKKMIRIESTNAKIVKMSSGALRIDHASCTHATSGNDGKRDRSKCRARVEKFVRELNEKNAK